MKASSKLGELELTVTRQFLDTQTLQTQRVLKDQRRHYTLQLQFMTHIAFKF